MMLQEPFAKGNSPIHQTNPVLRVILATIYSITVALMTQPAPLFIALCFSLGLIILARLPGKILMKRMAAAGAVLLFIWIVIPITYAGRPMAHIGPVAISDPGVRLCLQITLKAMAILLAFIALVATMPTTAMGFALHRLGAPAKLVQLLLLAYRYIFVIEQEYQRLFRAAKMRSFQPTTNIHTYRTYAYMVGMLFVRASERAGRVYQAMQCRGFTGQFFTLVKFAPTRWNVILATGVGLINMLIACWEWIL